jgi:hypothetical protein
MKIMETKFAPAERAPGLEVINLFELLSGVPLLDEILRSVPDVLLFLNKHRQIVFANRATFCFLGIEPTTDVHRNTTVFDGRRGRRTLGESERSAGKGSPRRAGGRLPASRGGDR